MGTLRLSTIVLAALLAAVIEFCLVCLVYGRCCCSFCLFLVRLFSLCLPICCGVSPMFFVLFMSSREGGLNPVHRSNIDFQYSSSSTRSQTTST